MAAAPIRIPLLSAVTAGTSQPMDLGEYEKVTIFLSSAGTTSGGTILIEEADWDALATAPYAGTWSQVASIAASSFTGTAMIAYHLSPTTLAYVRVRISSAITGGGTITVSARAAG